MSRFAGKAVIITGGSSGIGLAVAQRVVAEGGRTLVTGTDPAKLAAARADGIATLENDASDFSAAAQLAAEAERLFGRIDGVFLNAGIGGGSRLADMTPELFHRLFNLNVGGVLFGAQALAPLLNEGGSIVITASAAKDKGNATSALYAATKGAVRSMVRGLAREMAAKGIRVNTISPGPIETPFFERLGRSPEQLDALTQFIIGKNPMGRMGTLAEAAAVATFLLSSEAGFVTGSDYAVDGGEAQL